MHRLSEYIKLIHKNKLPLLGVCFGHQIIASSLGGKVDKHKLSGEYGVFDIETTQAISFFGLKIPKHFKDYLTLGQSVIHLPNGAISLAKSNTEPNQIIYYSEHTWDLQFHPEFTHEIFKFYLERSNNGLQICNGKDNDQIEAFGTIVLDTFFSFCKK